MPHILIILWPQIYEALLDLHILNDDFMKYIITYCPMLVNILLYELHVERMEKLVSRGDAPN